MSFLVQHIRSGEFARRPQPLDLAPGQLAVNYNNDSPGLFFRTDSGALIKAGPAHVGNAAPVQINYTERSIGEQWVDTTDPQSPALRIYTEAGWQIVNVLDGTVTTAKIADGAVTANKITLDNTIIPTTDSAFDLGSSVNRLNTVYTDSLDISSSFLPAADNAINLGSPTKRFANVYTGDLHLRNDKGDWTVVEEEDFLKVRNNKTGKEFRIVMEAI